MSVNLYNCHYIQFFLYFFLIKKYLNLLKKRTFLLCLPLLKTTAFSKKSLVKPGTVCYDSSRSLNDFLLHARAIQSSGSVVKRLRHRPFTAVTRVRFPSESFRYADVAQLAEQLICNQQVIGSSPIIGLGPFRDC